MAGRLKRPQARLADTEPQRLRVARLLAGTSIGDQGADAGVTGDRFGRVDPGATYGAWWGGLGHERQISEDDKLSIVNLANPTIHASGCLISAFAIQSHYMREFHDTLRAHLGREGAPLRKDFASKLDVSAPFITDLCAGRRTPPPDKIDLMVKILELSDQEAEEFHLAAALSHLPEQLRKGIAWKLEHVRERERRERNATFLLLTMIDDGLKPTREQAKAIIKSDKVPDFYEPARAEIPRLLQSPDHGASTETP